MTQTSPPKLYADVEAALGESLAEFVAGRRTEGVSWRRIAVEILTRTDIDITGETLRVWTCGRAPVDGNSTPPGTPRPSSPPPQPKPPAGPHRAHAEALA